jgi:hypothetical protein
MPYCLIPNHKMEARRSTLLAVVFLAACATASTGIEPTGNGEYSISKTDMRDEGTLLASLYVRAFAFCNDNHLSLEKLSQETHEGQFMVSNASATLRFRCKR